MSLGRSVKARPKNKWITTETGIINIVKDYEVYKNENLVLDYVIGLADTIVI